MTTNPFDLTGPPYPKPITSAGIGTDFTIGVSPIGDLGPDFDYRATIISQYANSPRITGLIDYFDAWIDQTDNFDDFFDKIMNIQSAEGYGLDVWGRIVGINRTLQVQQGFWFGFQEALPSSRTFGEAALYSGQPLTSNYRLADQAYRQLILAKAKFNLSGGSITDINDILQYMFPHRGNAYVTEGGHVTPFFGFNEALPGSEPFNSAPFFSGQAFDRMIMTYTFKFQLSPLELAIVAQSGVLPKPTGVRASVVINF